jgi:SAM-dependent methyltransferase
MRVNHSMSATENVGNKIAAVGFVEGLKRYLRSRLRGLGWDLVRYRPRPKWPEEEGRFEYQKRCREFQVAPGSVVLDIGGGHYPFPLATIVSDLYLEDSPHRTDVLVRDHRPLLKLDIHCLPFADKSIDFLYCSHVLEHVARPLQACREMIRVAKEGYIETPNFGKDILFGWANLIGHRWHVTTIGNTIAFFEYSDRQKKGIGSPAWLDLIFADYYHPIQEAFYQNQDIFNEMFGWRNSFRVFVFRLDGTVETSDES